MLDDAQTKKAAECDEFLFKLRAGLVTKEEIERQRETALEEMSKRGKRKRVSEPSAAAMKRRRRRVMIR